MAGEGNWYDLRVYVGNIGRYNEGSLVGGWATLPMGRDDLDAVSYTHLTLPTTVTV